MNNILLPIINECESKGFSFDGDAIRRFEIYYNFLVQENEKYNLTAITEKGEVALKHFADCMIFATRLNITDGTKICDVGSGAGFPGMVLKILYPKADVTLVDSLNKRVQFLSQLGNQLGLEVNALHSRAEEAGQNKNLRESFDIVTARAVANMAVLSELCLPLVRVGGCFAAMKGPAAEEELANAGGIKLLGGDKPLIYSDQLEDIGQRRTVICKKISQTPTKYPRIFAKISKQPL
ncbi:MAG: 16S rRNA (guanine(527)-N(7))-methyltransferase RsmG [Clostridia bacterium]|nr:16S rRNA (guanine(527)-N(7))-methyltransferase RsmG [Clostridia bacterium]